MIPGPVMSRLPVDPGAAQRQPSEAATEGAEGGASFAELLAAMLAPGTIQTIPYDTAPPETVEAVFERLESAEIFNETGLFRGAAPLAPTAQPNEAPDRAATLPEPSGETPPQVSLSPPAEAPAAPTEAPTDIAATTAQTASAGRSGGSGVMASAGPVRAASSLRPQAAAAATIPHQAVETAKETAGGGRVSGRTAAMLLQAYLAKAGSTAAQVSVQAVEGGISLVARADKLSREERDRLRIEIGELLARHGFAAAEMMLNGEPWPLPEGKEE